MKKLAFLLGALLAIGTAGSALGAEFKFNGDLNNRFNLYTNQATMFNGVESVADPVSGSGPLDDSDIEEFWADLKYRLQAEMSTNDGRAKGVYAMEIGAIRFGRGGQGASTGGGYSGDSVNVETRFAYTDFALTDNTRLTIGLQPFTVNKYVWSETATGVKAAFKLGAADLTLAWMRGNELFNNDEDDDLFEDADAFLLRGNFKPAKDAKLGAFVLYQRSDPGDDAGAPVLTHLLKQWREVEYDLYTFGVDGSFTVPTGIGNFFVNADALLQTGDAEALGVDADFKGYFLHADIGTTLGKTRFTYTTWYASGMEEDDDDIDMFIATDVDTFDSVIFFEGGYTDDNYFTEAPYILNFGMFFNKLAVDQKVSDKLSFGGALIYAMTAEDITLVDGSSEDTLGFEVDAYVSYKLFPNLELAANVGYLFADDAMDFWEVAADQDGSSDVDPYRITARARYSF